jgi:DNA-binding PadR family transcriptional regulator
MNARLFVLGLLAMRPMSGYEIRKWIVSGHAELWANVLPGSIHYALRKATDEGLVSVRSTAHSGRRRRVVYGITVRGRRHLKTLLRKCWSTPPRSFPTQINTALVFVDQLSRSEVRRALHKSIAELTRWKRVWQQGREHKKGLGEAVEASINNSEKHIDADLRYLKRLLALLA